MRGRSANGAAGSRGRMLHMDWRTTSNVLLTVAIAYFAFRTWKATKSYARMTGLSLFLAQFNVVVTACGGARKAAIDALRMIKNEFPDIYEAMKKHISADTRKEIETQK